MSMTYYSKKTVALSALILMGQALLSGCNNYLVFTTATKFGLDVSQEAGQPPKMALGYKRAEAAIIPAEHKLANETDDTYAVLSDFCVMANPSIYDWWDTLKTSNANPEGVRDSLQIRSIFATGLAAREAAETEAIQAHFARAVMQRTRMGATDKHCF